MKDFQVTATHDKKNNALNLTLQGKLNISNIKLIEQEFTKAVKGAKKCSIVLSNIEEADLSIIQLLKAYELTCKKNNIDLKITTDLNEDIATLFAKSGLNNLFN
jgi:ABC-type transporter Mla MlaB component